MKKGSPWKIVGIVLITMVILAVAGFATLWMMFPPQKIKDMVIPQVEKALGRKVQIQKAGLSIYPSIGVSLSGVEISNTNRSGYSQDPFIRLGRFNISVDVLSILRRRPEIGKILISKPQVLLEIDTSGSFNYSDLAMLEKDSSAVEKNKHGAIPMLPVPLTLKSLIIENGVIQYTDRKSGQQFAIEDMDYDLRLSIDKQLKDINASGGLRLNQVSVRTKEIKKPLSKLSIALDHDLGLDLIDGKAQLRQLRLSLQKVVLNLTGSVVNFNNKPELNLLLDSEPIAIKDLLAEIPVELVPVLAELTASGTADLALTLKGVIEEGKIPVQGSLKLSDAMVKYVSLPKSISGLNTEILFTDSSLSVPDLKMQFGSNPVSIRGSVVNFKKPLIDAFLNARLDLLDFKDVIEIPSGAALSGIIETDVTAKGVVDPADHSKLDMTGNAFFKNVSVLWPPLVKPAIINGNFTLSSKAIGENLDLKIGKSSTTMSAAVSNYLSLIFKDKDGKNPRTSADFKIVSTELDIDEFYPPAPEKTEEKKAASTQSTPLIAPLPGVDLKGTISANKIVFKGIEMKNMNARISSVNDVADIDIKTGFVSGTISENIHMDLRNTNNIAFKNKLSVSNVLISDLLSQFRNLLAPTNSLNTGLKTIENTLIGSINLSSELTGNGATSQDLTKNLKGDVSFKVRDGKISNSIIVQKMSGVVEKFVSIDDIKFRDLSALLKINDEKVFFENLKIQSDALGDFDVKGNMGFDAAFDIEVWNRMSRPASSKLLSAQSGVKNTLKGTLDNALKGTGLAGASGLLDQVGIPADSDGRVTLKIGLGGTSSNPKASFLGFGPGAKTQGSQQPSAKQQVTEKVQDVINQKKEQLQKKVEKTVEEQRSKVEAEIQKQTQEQKSAIESQLKKQEEELKKKAARLKKMF